MSAQNTLIKCSIAGIKVLLTGDNIKVVAQKGKIDRDLVEEIRRYKNQIIDILKIQVNTNLNVSEGALLTLTTSDFPLAKISQDELNTVQKNASNIENIYQVTPMQAGMLYHGMLDGSGASYATQFSFNLTGNVDVAALKQSWQCLVDHYDILRTSFVSFASGNVNQIVHKNVELPIDEIDWRELSRDDIPQKLADFHAKDKQRGFDFSSAPLMRISLITLADNQLHCLWTHHHILLDGWCLPKVFQALMVFYNTLSMGQTPMLEKPKPYANFIGWLVQQNQTKARAFWEAYLDGVNAPTQISVDKLPVYDEEFGHQTQSLVIGSGISQQLSRLAQETSCTLNTVVQVAWAKLLQIYSGDNSVIFGATVSGRPASLDGVEDMVGLFISTIPVRVDFSRHEGLGSLLTTLQNNYVASQEYSFFPLNEIQQLSGIANGTSLFDSLVVFENYPVGEAVKEQNAASEDQVVMDDISADERTNYALTLIASFQQDHLVLKCYFEGEEFSNATIMRMLGHLEMILTKISSGGAALKLNTINLLTNKESEQLDQWQGNYRPGNGYACVHALFEQQAQQTPDSPALRFGDQLLSYAELNDKANQLARYLLEQGVQAGELVALNLPRSIDMIVAVLGIIKAGAAYVPIDPDYPELRKSYIISNAQIKYIIADSDCSFIQSEAHTPIIDVVRIDQDATRNTIAAMPASDLKLGVIDHNAPLYCLYTSGTTGKPKGTLLPHRTITNLLAAQGKHSPSLAEPMCILQFASLSFDVSCQEIMTALCNGGELVLVDKDTRMDMDRLIDTIMASSISCVFLPYAVLQALSIAAANRGQSMATLTCIVTAGEQLHITREIKALLDRFPRCQLINHYGPTESHVVTAYALDKAPLKVGQLPPIGHALENVTTLILGADGQRVPIGVPGELHLGGDALAIGYVNNPTLTAEKFISHPFIKNGNLRLYKTGDIVRWNTEGEIEYLTRADHQVKIRGHRVELGEVEAALLALTHVRECVALTQGEPKRIVAYICINNLNAVDETSKAECIQATRIQLKNAVPEYMLPSALVLLDHIPVTANGKVDRQKLPAPEDIAAGQNYCAPSNDTEKTLCEIWQSVLKQEQVGIDDDFFELGGHSLLATQLVSRVRQSIDTELPLKALFDHPTVRELSAYISQHHDFTDGITFEKVDRNQPLLPSYSQQRLWFIDQLETHSAHYNLSGAFGIRASINPDIFVQALRYLIHRHETLRTVFIERDGQVYQKILDDIELPYEFFDVSAIANESEKQNNVAQIKHDGLSKRFDLARDLPLRVQLIKMADEEYMVAYCMHHIASDGWSLSLFNQELGTCYAAFAEGNREPLPALNVHFADYAVWQRKQIEVKGAGLVTYWKQQLDGAPPVHGLPLDKNRPSHQSFQGKAMNVALGAEQLTKIQAYCQAHDITLFMFLQTSFAILLSRYSREQDVVMGTAVAGRSHEDLEALIGFFVNTLVLRSHFDEGASFHQAITQNRDMILSAFEHQHMPFDLLVDELKPERSLSYPPIFQILFSLQNYVEDEHSTLASVVSSNSVFDSTTRYDLELSAQEVQDGLVLCWNYNSSLFSGEKIRRLSESFAILIDDALNHPDKAILQLNLLSEAQRQKMLSANQNGHMAYPKEKSVHALFEAQVAKSPAAVALSFGDVHYRYEELNHKANQLARCLREQGVSTGHLVGVCLERSQEMLVALLAIMKAGAAYVPLDPKYPEDRLAYMVEDSGLAVLLGDTPSLDILRDKVKTCIDVERDSYTAYEKTNLTDKEFSPTQLAYVIYTSGSTGMPKGVMITHQNVVNFLTSMAAQPGIKASTCLLAVTSMSFDIHVLELFLPLLVGARLVIASREDALSAENLMRLIDVHQVSMMQATPVTWSMLMQGGWQASRPFKALCGGEALPVNLKEALTACPHIELWNMYGPTETTVWSSATRVHAGENIVLDGLVGNTQFYILNQHRALAPEGTIGELYIGGDGLAAGYLHRPELTQARFVDNPFVECEGHVASPRIYKTGDLVRCQEDGRIEYIGREDFQVKIRGFRIELGEIEHVLTQHQKVLNAAVTVNYLRQGEPSLVAHLIVEQDIDNTEAEFNEALRGWLNQFLPEYMVPGIYLYSDTFPLTPNGKIDRKRLPTPELDQLPSQAYVAPGTASEKLVAAIWADVLMIESGRIGIHDNFFALGGHSLSIVQVNARIQSECRVQLPLKDIFEHAQLHRLAALIEEKCAQGQGEEIVIPRVNRSEQLPLSFAQQRLWFLNAFTDGKDATYNIPTAIRLVGELDLECIRRCFQTIVNRHETLRTHFATIEGNGVQMIQPALPLDIPEIPIREDEIDEYLRMHAGQVFDLSSAPLINVGILTIDSHDHILLVNMHHIISDGVSMDILLRECFLLYGAYQNNMASPLPPLSRQYADFASWQRQASQGDKLTQQLHYWRDQLAGAPALLDIPGDRPRPALQSFRGSTESMYLPISSIDQLKQLCQQQGATLFMGMLSVFSLLLSRYAKQNDIVIGSPVTNRPRPELENLIGLFVNTLALRVQIAPELNFIDLLQRVKNTCLGAYSHQDIPFEQLVDELKPERSLSYSPIFQVMFTLQNQASAHSVNEKWDGSGETSLALPFSVSSLKSELQVAKFDMTLSLQDRGDQLIGTWEYNADIFDPATIQQMIRHFAFVLDQLVTHPQQALNRVSMLSDDEYHMMARDWSGVDMDFPREKTLHQCFEEQAARSPEAIAVVYSDTQLSYASLNQRANVLAHQLVAQGAGAGVAVGVCVDRSADMLIALLAVLKSGAHYIPLDATYPSARLEYMLSDSGAKLLLTCGAFKNDLTVPAECALIDILEVMRGSTEQTHNLIGQNISPQDLAYVIYTSGTTGKPKGVMVSHRSVVNFLSCMADEPGIHKDNALLAVTSISFDIHVLELYLPLIRGARVVVADSDDAHQPDKLAGLIRRENIDMMQATPSTWKMLQNDAWRPKRGIKVLCGGEALDEDLKAYLLASDKVELWNMYGPTEACVWVSAKKIASQDEKIRLAGPIGNTQFVVLDDHLMPVPYGIVGELYIGGECLAKGYHNRADLSAERFIPHPKNKNERLYKTGDLVRLLADKALDYIGRSDNQIKLRGFRIELSEIESIAKTNAFVSQAVAVIRGQPECIALYLVPHRENALSTYELVDQLKNMMRASLPDYMMPTHFIALEKLPLTLNGKIDRKALPNIEVYDAEQYVAPSSDEEVILCQIWSALLKVEDVSVTDNFFQLGGNSVMLISMINTAKKYALNISVKDAVKFQTIRELSHHLNAGQAKQPDSTDGSELRLAILGQRWFFSVNFENPSRWNMPRLYVTRVDLDASLLRQTVETLVAHHPSLRTSFTLVSRHWKWSVKDKGQDCFFEEDISHIPDGEQSAKISLLCDEYQDRFDLLNGPLFQILFIKCGDGKNDRLFFNIHHLVSDASSREILIEDLYNVYTQLSIGESPKLPTASSTMGQLARKVAASERNLDSFRDDFNYWRQRPWQDMADFPCDYQQVPKQCLIGKTSSLEALLTKEQTEQLMSLVSSRSDIKLVDIIYAGLMRAVTSLSGKNNLPIMVTNDGRMALSDIYDLDLSRTVGWVSYSYIIFIPKLSSGNPIDEVINISNELAKVPSYGATYDLMVNNEFNPRSIQAPAAGVRNTLLFTHQGNYIDTGSEYDDRSPLVISDEDLGFFCDERNENQWTFWCVTSIENGQLKIKWQYSEDMYRESTIKDLVEKFVEHMLLLNDTYHNAQYHQHQDSEECLES